MSQARLARPPRTSGQGTSEPGVASWSLKAFRRLDAWPRGGGGGGGGRRNVRRRPKHANERSATATRRLGAPTATPQCLGGARPLSDGGNRAIRTSAVPVARNRCLVCVCVLSETCILIYVLAQAATGGNAIQARGVATPRYNASGGERRVVFGRSASRRRREVRRDPDYAGASVVYSAV